MLALRQIFTGKTHFVDVGSLQDAQGRVVYWNNTIGIGFDTAVVIRSRNYRLVRGFGAYLIAVIQTIIFNDDASQIRVTTDSEAWNEQTTMLVLCNGARGGEESLYRLVLAQMMGSLTMLVCAVFPV